MNATGSQQPVRHHSGKTASGWDINRAAGRRECLRYLTGAPLGADHVCRALGTSRFDVSMGRKETEFSRRAGLGHLPGDRRDSFSTPEGVRATQTTPLTERRKREIGPTPGMLHAKVMAESGDQRRRHAKSRVDQRPNPPPIHAQTETTRCL